jgi:hypothetical protein
MNTNQPNYLFLNTVQAAAADVTTSRGKVVLGASANVSPAIEAALAESLTEQAAAAAVAQVQVLTVSAATADQDYGINISFKDTLSGEYTTRYVSTKGVTGDTVTTIAARLVAAVNALINAGAVDLASCANVAGAITFTATTANPLFTIVPLTAGFTLAAPSTAGVVAKGQGADLLAAGLQTISEVPVSGTSYDLIIINYAAPISDGNTVKRDQFAQLYVYYNNTNATNAGAFKTAVEAAFPAASIS